MAARVTREAFAERVPILAECGDRERRAGDRLDGGLDGRTRLQRVDGQRRRADGRGGLERVQTGRAARVRRRRSRIRARPPPPSPGTRWRSRRRASRSRRSRRRSRPRRRRGPGRRGGSAPRVRAWRVRRRPRRSDVRRAATGPRARSRHVRHPRSRDPSSEYPAQGIQTIGPEGAGAPAGSAIRAGRRRAPRRSPRPSRGTGGRPRRTSRRPSGARASRTAAPEVPCRNPRTGRRHPNERPAFRRAPPGRRRRTTRGSDRPRGRAPPSPTVTGPPIPFHPSIVPASVEGRRSRSAGDARAVSRNAAGGEAEMHAHALEHQMRDARPSR